MSAELVVFTHNDLDALGSMLNIEYRTKDIQKEYYYTNYSNIPEIVNSIIVAIKQETAPIVKHMIIVDVSFADNKEQLIKLYTECVKQNVKITYIDHHLYPTDFFDSFPCMNITHDKSKSATLLTHEFLKNQEHVNLAKLTRLIDVYDIWQMNEPEFNFTQDLNAYFWSKTKTENLSIEDLMNLIIDSNWKLPPDFTTLTVQLKNQQTREINDYKMRNLIKKSGEITLCFIPDNFNPVMIEEMNKGQNFVIGINQYGIVRFRINQKAPYTDEQKNKIRKELTGTETTGHMDAFTYKYSGELTFDNSIKEAQTIVQTIVQTIQEN